MFTQVYPTGATAVFSNSEYDSNGKTLYEDLSQILDCMGLVISRQMSYKYMHIHLYIFITLPFIFLTHTSYSS